MTTLVYRIDKLLMLHQLSRSFILNFSRDQFNQLCSDKCKIAPAVLLLHESK